jgi:hypothetical protein
VIELSQRLLAHAGPNEPETGPYRNIWRLLREAAAALNEAHEIMGSIYDAGYDDEGVAANRIVDWWHKYDLETLPETTDAMKAEQE